ncbi:MAG: hypothetical protein O3A01_06630 [bacterium]|nr:hypothetical protein [bacterium]
MLSLTELEPSVFSAAASVVQNYTTSTTLLREIESKTQVSIPLLQQECTDIERALKNKRSKKKELLERLDVTAQLIAHLDRIHGALLTRDVFLND